VNCDKHPETSTVLKQELIKSSNYFSNISVLLVLRKLQPSEIRMSGFGFAKSKAYFKHEEERY
jgi:hypothetical protein